MPAADAAGWFLDCSVELMATQAHENLTSYRHVEASSGRKFGVTIGLILAGLAMWPYLRHGMPVRVWLLGIGGGLFISGLVAPKLIEPLNRAWFKLGLLLARITNPIVMGIMFFAAVLPIGWLIRRRGVDLLRLRRSAASDTYWIERTEPATALTKQF